MHSHHESPLRRSKGDTALGIDVQDNDIYPFTQLSIPGDDLTVP